MRVHINKEYEEQRKFIESIPALFVSNGGKLILESRNIVRLFPEQGFVAKEFHKINFINKFVYACIRKSKAQRSFEYAQRLIANGFGSPEPVAWIDIKRCFLGIPFLPVILRSSFYICRECTWPSLQEICGMEPAEDTDFIVKAYAADVVRMHNCGIVPVDTNPGNVFYKVSSLEGVGGTGHGSGVGSEPLSSVRFQYIDLNRMHLYNRPAPMLVRYKSIARMSNSQAMFERIASLYFSIYYNVSEGNMDSRVETAVECCRMERRKFYSRMELKDKLKGRR